MTLEETIPYHYGKWGKVGTSLREYFSSAKLLRDKILSGELKTYPYYSEKYGNMVLKYESKFESITLEVDTYKILTYQPK